MEKLNRTPLYEAHLKAAAKMVEFAGWQMPIEYSGLVDEHQAVRQAAGIFDVSHMGEIAIKGKDALAYTQYLVANDIKSLRDKQVLYTHMCYQDGGTVDDLLVYRMAEDHFYLVVNASNVAKDVTWIESNKADYDVEIINLSDETAEIAIQGPQAEKILQKTTDCDLSQIKFFHFETDVEIAGKKCLVSRTGYTGEDGFEVYTDNANILDIWQRLLEVGEAEGLKPAGLGCRDTLRFEVALPLYGNELSKEISPIEAGLGFFVKLDGDDFIGKAALADQKANRQRKLVGFEMVDSGIPRHGYAVQLNGEVIGQVTTGYYSPSTGRTVGHALIKNGLTELGSEIAIQIRKKTKKAKVVKKKFYDKKYKDK